MKCIRLKVQNGAFMAYNSMQLFSITPPNVTIRDVTVRYY